MTETHINHPVVQPHSRIFIQYNDLIVSHSIFIISEDNADVLREMGGVAFVYNLSKSSIVHSDVKETALFTLGTLAEANGRCVDVYVIQYRGRVSEGCSLRSCVPLHHLKPSVR